MHINLITHSICVANIVASNDMRTQGNENQRLYMMGLGRVGIGRRDVYKVPATIPQFKFTHTYVEWTEWTIPTYMYYIYCTFTRICLINLIFLILFPLHNIIHISCHIWLRCIPYNQAISLALYALVASTTYATLFCRPSCVCILQNVYYIQTMSYWVTSAAYITRECRGASTPRKLRQPTRAYTQLGWYIPCVCVCAECECEEIWEYYTYCSAIVYLYIYRYVLI